MRNNERAGGHHPALGRPSLVEPATTHAAMKKKQASESAALSVSERLAIFCNACYFRIPFSFWRCARRAKYADATADKVPPAPAWSSSLCDCTSDVGTCAIVFCCPFVVAPQLYEREVGPPGVCRKWFIRICILCCISFVIATARNVIMSFSYGWSCGQYNEYGQNCNWENYPWLVEATLGAGSLIVICAIVAILTVLMKRVRGRLRKRDGIPGNSRCPRTADCCVTLMCLWCVQCQILRHLGLVWGWPLWGARRREKRVGRYQLTSPVGEKPIVVEAEDEEAAMARIASETREARELDAALAATEPTAFEALTGVQRTAEEAEL